MHALVRSIIQVTRLQGTPAGWNLLNFPSLKLDFSFCSIPVIVSLSEQPGGTNHIIHWIRMQTQQRHEWGAAATNKCWAALLRAASGKKTRQKWKREGNLLSRFSSVYTEGAWQCEMCLVWARSPPRLASSGEVISGGRYPLAPSGKRRWGAPGRRKVESVLFSFR